jgi:DNA-binding NarL/FixJ family response regulator
MTVLVADDHPIYVEGLVNLLHSYDFTVAGNAADGAEAVRLACKLKPDVVLMDANMPVMDGIEATKQIRQAVPDTKVIILTGIEDDELLYRAVQAGASGFLLKRLDGSSLHKDLLELQAGRNPFSPGLGDLLLKKFTGNETGKTRKVQHCPLTGREIHVLQCLSRGMTYKEIGNEIHLSEQAIKYHIKKIKEQCDIHTLAELIVLYRDEYAGSL